MPILVPAATSPTLPSFATIPDLEAMLGRTFDETERVQVQQLLDDASDHLRDLIGQQISAGTTTFTDKVPVQAGRLLLPQQPVRSVDAVTLSGQSWTNYEAINGYLYFDRYGDLSLSNHFMVVGGRYGFVSATVTYQHGTTEVPSDLRKHTRVLAAQALAQIEAFGSVGSAGLTSQRVDDFAENFATTGDASRAYSLHPDDVTRLKTRYGRTAYVSGADR